MGYVPTSQLLLRAGSEVNMTGPCGKTPLMIAASNPDLSILVDNLLNYEADPLFMDEEGHNAIDHAGDEHIKDMLKTFFDEAAKGLADEDNVEEQKTYSTPFGMIDQPVYTETSVGQQGIGNGKLALARLRDVFIDCSV